MAASPSSVLTLGYGSWGSANLVPTLGYGSGEADVVTEGVQFSLPSMRPEFSLPTLPQFSEGTL
jgi:hypothetical protein